ncbi:MAG: DinB family protein [Bryobacteraceae bacterium]
MKYALIVSAIISLPLSAQEGVIQNSFGQEFLKHWTAARDLTLSVAQAMPPENYDFKPNPEEMSFGEQMIHIAGGNYVYCSRISGAKSPFAKPDKPDQATAVSMLKQSFEYCANAIDAAKDLNAMRGPEGKQMSLREVMLGAYAHMAHHRGQAEVYLRLKGIKPPAYNF